MKTVFENPDVIVCIKEPGMSSEYKENDENSLPFLIEKQIGKTPFTIHRLDVGVGGLIVYAKNKKSAAFLSECITNGSFTKEYTALVRGEIKEESGHFSDLLFKDSKRNKTFVVNRMRTGVRQAELDYSVIKKGFDEKGEYNLIRIHLITGRSHQIRVQFSSRKLFLFGDGKYGSKDNSKNICLWSSFLSFPDIQKGEPLTFECEPPFDA